MMMFILWLLLAVLLLVGLRFLLHLTVLKLPRCISEVKLQGKTVIVTGANTGIGKTTALDLARRGARVILACRDRGRSEAAVQDIIQQTGNQQVVFMQLDLASLKSVRSFAENFLKSESRLDLLINNAGIFMGGRTEEGFGMIFGVNHLGHFLLTVLLLERLKEAGGGRVVTVSSKAHEMGRVNFHCLRTERDLSLGEDQIQILNKYAHSKLCNVLFTQELATRLEGSEVTCYSLHPGVIKTEIGRHSSLWWKALIWPFSQFFFVDPDSGAQTTLYCALEPGIEPLSGQYFSGCAPLTLRHPQTTDNATARKLWELSESFCGLA